MRLKHFLFIAAIAGGSAWIAQAQLPGLGGIKSKIDSTKNKAKPATDRAEKAGDAFASWSPEEEEGIGEASAAKLIAMFGLMESDSLNAYVNLVGTAVAQFAPRQIPYRFGVLDTDMVGAFATPGGFVFVTKGAIAGMKNEAELAGVFGHEIIHASERHLESEIRTSKTSKWATQELKAVRGPSGTEAFRAKAESVVGDLLDMKMSRGKEDGADERGSALATQAGYAPDGLMNFLITLEASGSSPKATKAFGQLFSTHPPLDERIAKLRAWVEKQTKKGVTNEQRFLDGTQ
jgi:predicted Zn-dependent protease